ncbi:hypothetical protein BTA51_20605 [Hahella sp. CCB-MM4]|uniref:ABC transporter permease subunit n=1 Tax=Hahella sp. (strain CCB-MM4) TaxID=1926491 RepID=UPI000B9C5DC2|nr:ABC transporter permease subunit [Hahella sp. CCB-MM4]OZG71353.1 hypothetical protein BTA51_20605 [Hahella sp. CCB-MM4]
MNSIRYIAQKEFRDGLRNRWILAITLVFALLSLGITWFGAAASGQVGFTSIPATIASLTSLASFLIPLIALLIAYDAIVGEEEGGTLLLLLAYPISRGELLVGKFCGHALILGLAALAGFGSAALAIGLFAEGINLMEMSLAFGRFVFSSMLLGWVFLAMGYIASAKVAEKSRAAGLALAIWFLFVLVFDLSLLAFLAISQGKLSPELLPWLLMLNPADIYRLINLTALDGFGGVSGVLALGSDLPVSDGLWWVLLGWIAIPLSLARWLFSRRTI